MYLLVYCFVVWVGSVCDKTLQYNYMFILQLKNAPEQQFSALSVVGAL